MYCNQIMALMDAFKEKIQSWVSPLFPFFFFSFDFFPAGSLCLRPHSEADMVEVTGQRWVYWDGQKARRPQTLYGCAMTIILPRNPPTPTNPSPFADIIQGRVWVAVKNDHHPRSPNHRRGQSPSNKSGTSSKVIIDKGWHANVDTGEIILWGQWLHISCFQRGRRCLMYKYCGGTLFPYLLRDYKRSRVETIRDAGSHGSFL